MISIFVFFQAEDGIRDYKVTGVQTCALPISTGGSMGGSPVQDRPPSPGSPSRPVVIVVSSTHEPSWISAARAVAAVFPCLSQVTWTRAGSERGTRRKCALVATG